MPHILSRVCPERAICSKYAFPIEESLFSASEHWYITSCSLDPGRLIVFASKTTSSMGPAATSPQAYARAQKQHNYTITIQIFKDLRLGILLLVYTWVPVRREQHKHIYTSLYGRRSSPLLSHTSRTLQQIQALRGSTTTARSSSKHPNLTIPHHPHLNILLLLNEIGNKIPPRGVGGSISCSRPRGCCRRCPCKTPASLIINQSGPCLANSLRTDLPRSMGSLTSNPAPFLQ